jgi:4-hydroxybenzoate polyprenyltransferase
MAAYYKILRPLNLVIVTLTQGLLFFIIHSAYQKAGVLPILDGPLITLFIICTLCLAASANVINDILDIDIDLHNKRKNIVGSAITRKQAYLYYSLITLIGLILAAYIGVEIGRPGLILIYPVAAMVLYFYSKSFKGMPLLGNLVVAAFCAFVPGILWYGELDALHLLKSKDLIGYEVITYLLSGFVIFSFMTNLVRELVKDIEDYPGDKIHGIRTYPVAYGIPRARVFALFNMMMTLLIVVFWWYSGRDLYSGSRIHSLAIAPLIFPPLVIINHLTKIPDLIRVRLASYWLKVYMVIGLLILLILA